MELLNNIQKDVDFRSNGILNKLAYFIATILVRCLEILTIEYSNIETDYNVKYLYDLISLMVLTSSPIIVKK